MLASPTFESPIGTLRLIASPAGVRAISFPPHTITATSDAPNPHLDHLARELDAYFAARLTTFTVPLDFRGTPFQLRVWRALLDIPHAQTRSYADIARAIDQPAATRAVGLANNHNRIPIVIPCHRVIGSTGKLTGYGGELWRKEWLLKHEGIPLPESLFPPAHASSPS